MTKLTSPDPKLRTLCIIQEGDKVLLGLKKRGFGEGKWNGFGGKLQAGETLRAAIIRELNEESSLTLIACEERAQLYYTFGNGIPDIQMHVFKALAYSGEPAESEEMRPQWFAIPKIPYELMWADTQHWLPPFLAGQRFRGQFHYHDEANLGPFSLVPAETNTIA